MNSFGSHLFVSMSFCKSFLFVVPTHIISQCTNVFFCQILDCCTLVFVSLLEERAFLALTKKKSFILLSSATNKVLCIGGNGRRRGAYRSSTRSVRPNVKDLGWSYNSQGCQSGVTANVENHLHSRYKQMKNITPLGIIAEQASDRLKDQTRLSFLSWNAGLKRGQVTNSVVGLKQWPCQGNKISFVGVHFAMVSNGVDTCCQIRLCPWHPQRSMPLPAS